MFNPLKVIIEKIYLSFNDNLVYYDSVTRCKSRFYYDTIICKKYNHRECKVVYIDINNLKRINDLFGHYNGTMHIKSIANQLKKLDNVEHICRVGGDEFVLVCNTNFNKESLSKVHGISAGVIYKRKRDTWEYTIKKADAAMYKMKKAPR